MKYQSLEIRTFSYFSRSVYILKMNFGVSSSDLLHEV